MLQKRPNVLIVFHQEDAGHRRWLPRNWAEAPTRQRDPAPPVPCCCNPCELRASRPCERLGRGEPPIDLMQLKTRAAAGRNVPSSAVSLSRPWFLHSARSPKNLWSPCLPRLRRPFLVGRPDSCSALRAVLHRQDHAVADIAGFVSAEELNLGEQPEFHRDEALARRIGAQLVERVP